MNVTRLVGAAQERDIEPLTVRLLGSPQVTLGQRPLSFQTRKVLALLVYLMVEGGRPSRETLVALLWPESPPEKAAATLRGTLSRLRKALQPGGSYLLSEGNTVAFDFDQVHDLDLAWLAAAARMEATSDELAAVLALDRGEFLEGFSLPDAPAFDTWAAIQRAVCQRQLEAVYDRLSQHQLAAHDSGAAVETAAQWVSRAPLNEQAYRRLMAAKTLNGQRPAALQTYRQLQTTLRDELDLGPARESSVLADNISRGRVRQERATPQSAPPSTDQNRHLTLPLVGRADEHRQLVGAYRQIGRDKTQVVALIGAAGVGKTRLVDAFLAWATLDAPEIETWQGRAHLALGQFEAARAALLDARAAAEEQEERAMLWRVLVKLSELEQAGSNTSAAGRLRDQARAVVDDIAAHAGRLRVIFMDQPAVVQLLEESL